MTLKYFIFTLLLISVFASCDKAENVDDFTIDYKESLLINEWIHSYDEDCFSPWMPFSSDRESYMLTWQVRNRLEIYENHTAVYTIDTPWDPYARETSTIIRGEWTYDPALKTLEIVSNDGDGKLVFMVNAISENGLNLMYKEFDPELYEK